MLTLIAEIYFKIIGLQFWLMRFPGLKNTSSRNYKLDFYTKYGLKVVRVVLEFPI